MVCLWLAAEERGLWTATLEEEEQHRRASLRAGINVLEAEEMPTPSQINALLASALQAQVTLMRMSRVFPSISSSRRTDVTNALGHGPTAALAGDLHRAWNVLGITGPTLIDLLRQVVFTVGTETQSARMDLFAAVIGSMRRGVDPKARASLAAEGSGQTLATYFVRHSRVFPSCDSMNKWS